jgi:energy-converting hydrogenase Eha subunit F
VRGITISRLRQIADYMDSLGRRTGIARVVGSGGGILAGTLTVAGGVLTVLTAGAAAPVLVSWLSLWLKNAFTLSKT